MESTIYLWSRVTGWQLSSLRLVVFNRALTSTVVSLEISHTKCIWSFISNKQVSLGNINIYIWKVSIKTFLFWTQLKTGWHELHRLCHLHPRELENIDIFYNFYKCNTSSALRINVFFLCKDKMRRTYWKYPNNLVLVRERKMDCLIRKLLRWLIINMHWAVITV